MSSTELVQDPVVTSTQDTVIKGKLSAPACQVSEVPVVAKAADKLENANPIDKDSHSVTSSTATKIEKPSQGDISQQSDVKTTSSSVKHEAPVKSSNTTVASSSESDVKPSQSTGQADEKTADSDSKDKDQVKGPKHFDKETYVEAPLPSKNPWKKPEPPKAPTAEKKPDPESQHHQSNDNNFTRPHGRKSGGYNRGGPSPRSPKTGKYHPKSGNAGKSDHRRAPDDKSKRHTSTGASKPQSSHSSHSQHGEPYIRTKENWKHDSRSFSQLCCSALKANLSFNKNIGFFN